ncbi:hypothetical protein FB567DRAFT_594603 [Paraphoma chrysanthemicola]|uniref:Uncharacterized protein n=1 Tax=Paraphoma chrysanthemicola TaxID=798071 RepID=A0A8K0R390_9PLEO|nr:hypothetical protein FB567DRAFT_594603 [Paraphoma chrysanthemicola]
MRLICLILFLSLVGFKACLAQPQPSSPPSPENPVPPANAPGRPIKALCKRIRLLTVLNKTANEPPTLASSKVKETQLAFLQANAAAFNAQLANLTSNATLLAECDIVNAARKDARTCRRLKRLEKVARLATNNTAEAQRRISKILKKMNNKKLNMTIAEAKVQLDQLKANATLVRLCATRAGSRQDEEQSGVIGDQTADNGGLIGATSKGASDSFNKTNLTTCLLASLLLAIFALL